MKDYVDVSIDIVSQDDFRYHVQTNPDFPDSVDILYQELEEGIWVTKNKLESLTSGVLDRIYSSCQIVSENSYLTDNIGD